MNITEYYKGLSDKAEIRSPRSDFKDKVSIECSVSKSTVWRWLTGQITPPALARKRIAEIIGINEKELFNETAN
ncbi:MAG: XRE family transcriptional regulator [Bacteroidales bacterium]